LIRDYSDNLGLIFRLPARRDIIGGGGSLLYVIDPIFGMIAPGKFWAIIPAPRGPSPLLSDHPRFVPHNCERRTISPPPLPRRWTARRAR
jgi:hypothetical protein